MVTHPYQKGTFATASLVYMDYRSTVASTSVGGGGVWCSAPPASMSHERDMAGALVIRVPLNGPRQSPLLHP